MKKYQLSDLDDLRGRLVIVDYQLSYNSSSPSKKEIQLIPSRDPNCIGIAIVRQVPGDLKIPARFNLVQDCIARLRSDPVLRCQMCDALSFIEFSVDQVVRRLEFH